MLCTIICLTTLFCTQGDIWRIYIYTFNEYMFHPYSLATYKPDRIRCILIFYTLHWWSLTFAPVGRILTLFLWSCTYSPSEISFHDNGTLYVTQLADDERVICRSTSKRCFVLFHHKPFGSFIVYPTLDYELVPSTPSLYWWHYIGRIDSYQRPFTSRNTSHYCSTN